jgi:coenzyme F420 hydrogenase subunit delta
MLDSSVQRDEMNFFRDAEVLLCDNDFMLTNISSKDILVFGCGNILFGDDGFGAAVVYYFQEHYTPPENVLVQDVGTGIREILFDLALSEKKPQKLIIVDAVDYPDRTPGEVFEISVDGIPAKKTSDFSLHQFPTVNILKELQEETDIAIHIIVAQVAHLPEEVQPGLSPEITQALPKACSRLMDLIAA